MRPQTPPLPVLLRLGLGAESHRGPLPPCPAPAGGCGWAFAELRPAADLGYGAGVSGRLAFQRGRSRLRGFREPRGVVTPKPG